MDGSLRIPDFERFWPFYVSQHRRSGTRALHFVGTTLAIALVATGAATGRSFLYAWALVAGYGFAWIGHFFVEKNRPATFQYPLWSLRGDFRMYALMWQGKMTAEVARVNRATVTATAGSAAS
jgi:hypothetical protein